jgi:tetratricopeptide (TPR) repeat protein
MSSSQLMKVRSRVAGTIIASLFALFATVCPTTARAAETSAAPGVSPDAERAAIAGDWNRTSQLLGKETGRLPAVSRMLLAHAYLATNHSNAALCLLLDTTAPADLREWAAWTERQVKQNPKSPAALYLRGDALARLKQWPEAIKAFTDAETGRKKELDVLIRVAKATALASQKDWKVDSVSSFGLTEAIKKDEPLAELHTTHGYLVLLNHGAATTAVKEFMRANELAQKAENSSSVSALLGVATAKAMVGQWEDAKKDVSTAAGLDVSCKSAIQPLLALEGTMLENALARTDMRKLAASAGVELKPGMSINEVRNATTQKMDKMPQENRQTYKNADNQEQKTSQKMAQQNMSSSVEVGGGIQSPKGGAGKAANRPGWDATFKWTINFGSGNDKTAAPADTKQGLDQQKSGGNKAGQGLPTDNQRIANQQKAANVAPPKENEMKPSKGSPTDNQRVATNQTRGGDNLGSPKLNDGKSLAASAADSYSNPNRSRSNTGGVDLNPLCGKSGASGVGGTCPAPQPGDVGIIPMFEALYTPGEPLAGKPNPTAARGVNK